MRLSVTTRRWFMNLLSSVVLILSLLGCSEISKEEQQSIVKNAVVNEIISDTIVPTFQAELNDVFRSLDSYWRDNCDADNEIYLGRGVYLSVEDFQVTFQAFKSKTIELLPTIKTLLTSNELNGDYMSMFKGSYTDYKQDDKSLSDFKANNEYYNDYFCEQLITYDCIFCHDEDSEEILSSVATYFDGRAIIRNGIPEIVEMERVKVPGIPICWKAKAKSSGYYYVSIFKDANGEWSGVAHKDTPDFSEAEE